MEFGCHELTVVGVSTKRLRSCAQPSTWLTLLVSCSNSNSAESTRTSLTRLSGAAWPNGTANDLEQRTETPWASGGAGHVRKYRCCSCEMP